MALFEFDDYEFDIVEWWDRLGVYHQGRPTTWALEHDAIEVTGQATYDDGEVRHADFYNHDGWTLDELLVEVNDAHAGGSL